MTRDAFRVFGYDVRRKSALCRAPRQLLLPGARPEWPSRPCGRVRAVLLPLFSLRWDCEVSGALRDSLGAADSGAGRLYGLFERMLIDISLMRFAFWSWWPSPSSPFGVVYGGAPGAEQRLPGSLG